MLSKKKAILNLWSWDFCETREWKIKPFTSTKPSNPTAQKLQLMWDFHFSQTKGKKTQPQNQNYPTFSSVFSATKQHPFLFTKIPRISHFITQKIITKTQTWPYFFPVFIKTRKSKNHVCLTKTTGKKTRSMQKFGVEASFLRNKTEHKFP